MHKDYESKDANVKTIMWVSIFAILSAIVVFISIGVLFFNLKSFFEKKTLKTAPANLIAERKGPPHPLLEINPRPKNKDHLAKERQLLNSYEWLDKDKGILRVPVKKAIEILLYE